MLPASFGPVSRTCLVQSDAEKAVAVFGIGNALAEVIAGLGGTAHEGCGCEDKIATMNAWGIEKCLENRKTIVKWIKEAAKKRGWKAKFEAKAKAKELGIPINILDAYGSVFDEAVRRFRSREPQSTDTSGNAHPVQQ